MSSPSELGTSLLMDVSDKLLSLAMDMGYPEEDAGTLANEVVTLLATDWGGQSVYIPMDMMARRSARNAEIFAKFTGDNVSKLATEFQLSTQNIYRIIKAERQRRAPKQCSLLD